MKRLFTLFILNATMLGVRAADTTIANLTSTATIADPWRMPWENPGVLDYSITFNGLTNLILNGMANQAFAQAAAQAATNGFPWGVLYDPVGAGTTAAQNATNLLGQVYLLLSGGTETGPVLSSSSTTNAPSGPELVTAHWVRSLLANGFVGYASTNVDINATNPGSGQLMFTFSGTIPVTNNRVYVAPNSGDYLGGVMTTNTFQTLQGPASINIFAAALGGSGGPSLSIHAEVYYSYDKTNWFGDFTSGNQTIAIGITNLYQFVVSFPTITATNASGFFIERRLKVGTATGATHPNLMFLIGTNAVSGTNDASHTFFSGSVSGNQPVTLTGDATGSGTGSIAVTVTNLQQGLITNKVHWTNVVSLTNSQFQKVDMQIKEGDFETNAGFAFLGIINKSTTNYQSAVIYVHNTTGSVVPITAPVNVFTNGFNSYTVTNYSVVLFTYHPLFNWTNMLVFPMN